MHALYSSRVHVRPMEKEGGAHNHRDSIIKPQEAPQPQPRVPRGCAKPGSVTQVWIELRNGILIAVQSFACIIRGIPVDSNSLHPSLL